MFSQISFRRSLQLLAKAGLDLYTGLPGFKPWLQRQLGPTVEADDFIAYLERKDIDASQILYRQGESADSIDFVGAGGIAVEPPAAGKHCAFGVLSRTPSSARWVSSDERIGRRRCHRTVRLLFFLTRANFERLRCERPDLAVVFADFIVRVLADRLDFANQEVLALTPSSD